MFAVETFWINAGGGSNGRINPLQIRPTPVDGNDDIYKDEGHGMGDMALYIKNLEIFFSLYLPSLNDMQKAILKDTLIGFITISISLGILMYQSLK
ncbi:MAG: hypothetical protein PWP31_839 [Clostridia bacterium]|nr:hypothetical protein [Clostridia bacterium]